MNNMITEGANKWSSIITEEYNVKNSTKLDWMSKYAAIHEIKESVQNGSSNGITATPLNTLGMANPMMPTGIGFNGSGDGSGIGNTGADFHNPKYGVGSGDLPMSTLPMALEIAAMTVGFELVPVIPSPGPMAMLTFLDNPYAGGKLGKINETALDGKGEGNENKPIYVKFNCPTITYEAGKGKRDIPVGSEVVVSVNDSAPKMNATFIGFSRINGDMIVKVKDCGDANTSIADVFEKATKVAITASGVVNTVATVDAGSMRADLVANSADHVQGFANFFNGSEESMTRAQNETGVGNTIGARYFSKLIQMGSFEVTGTVTRQQLQDMPLYGVDIVAKVLEAMQNEISQSINNRILDRVFKLGVTNAVNQKKIQGADLNLFFGKTVDEKKSLDKFTGASKFVGIDNKNHAAEWGDVFNATQNTAAENFTTHQRRIMSRVLAASNLIANVSRYGRADWIVTNTQMVTALQDCAGYIIAPMDNTMSNSNNGSIYFAGSIANMNVYVDPNMDWEDTRICVGRKSNGNTPGVVFMPYILADQVQIVAEGTMAPKLLINSRFAIVDAGFHPEQNYLTFLVDANGAVLI